MRIAAMGDLHFSSGSTTFYRALFKSAGRESDMVVLCGDLTTRGLIEEARGLSGNDQLLRVSGGRRARQP